MKPRTALTAALAALALTVPAAATASAAPNPMIGVNVALDGDITPARLKALSAHGTVTHQLPAIDALTMKARSSALAEIRALPFVEAANPDAKRVGKPVTPVAATDLTGGLSTWNLDQVDVTSGPGTSTRTVDETGDGVYVAVIDSGLLSTWRAYFPAERIATQYAAAFGGGGGERGSVSTQPNKWQTDQNSHGTHVTSTILGYAAGQTHVTGVAPQATVIPVKVLNNNGSGWSSVVAAGITHVADLKAGPLKGRPVVINMSLGGPALDAMEKAAIDYALEQGVLIVASAGNSGAAGMGYPGAYEPVISVAANGWTGEWVDPDGAGGLTGRDFWWAADVAEPTDAGDAYITDFSSRELDGQDLDLAAPGSWILGPYQVNGQLSHYFLGGTSMASPHVAGAVALLAERKAALTQEEADEVLTGTAVPLPEGSRTILAGPNGPAVEVTWDDDATGAGILNVPAALAAVGDLG